MITNKETRLLNSADAEHVANLHLKAFPNFFLTTLGEKFLKKFYESLLNSPKSFGIATFEGDSLIGFAVGTEQTQGFYRNLVLHNGLNLFSSCFNTLFFHPVKAIRILKNLISSNGVFEIDEGGWILSICTNPNYWGKGVSDLVLKEFEAEALKRKLKKIWLTTDFADNERANSFYLKMNYKLFASFVNSQKRKMNLYVKELNKL